MPPFEVFSLIFILVIILLVAEISHRVLAALIGAALVIFFGLRYGLLTGSSYIEFVDMETLLFIVGIMILVEAFSRSGLFQFIGMLAVKLSGGSVLRLYFILMILSVVLSAFLTTIPAMLIMGSLTVAIARHFHFDVREWILDEALMSNIGGLALQISSIPNMIVSSRIEIGFIEFVRVSAPLVVLLTVITVLYLSRGKERGKFDIEVKPWSVIEDKGVLIRIFLIFTVVIFLLGGSEFLGVDPETVALLGAVAVLTLGGMEPDTVLKNIDWGSVFFIASFYIIIGGLESSGVMEMLAMNAGRLLGMGGLVTSALNLWICAGMSAFLDNIPVTLLLTSMVAELSRLTGVAVRTLVWGIIFGANIGGNFLPFASPSLVIAAGILESEGKPVTVSYYLKNYLAPSILMLVVTTAYLLLKVA